VNRVGWVILALFALLGGGVALLTRIGGGEGARVLNDRLRAKVENRIGVSLSPGELAVPVKGVARSALRQSWGAPRDGGLRAHTGLDIPAPRGTPVLAAADGVIEKLYDSRFGGTALYERSPDRRWTYYYAHLAGYAAGLTEGDRVSAGQLIGYVGDSGNAGRRNYHLHFGLTRQRPEQRWWQGREVDPFPVLAGGRPRG